MIDLYCGVGSISLYISKYVKSVLGIEIIAQAIEDAKVNAKINNIDNANFICGDVAKLIDKNISGDVLIVDPPRKGLDNYTTQIINNSKIKKIIYVSCDPMTLVRDIKNLDKETVVETVKEQAKKVKKKADELVSYAAEKATPVVEAAAKEVKKSTVKTLENITAKLKEEEPKKTTTKKSTKASK